MLNHKHLLVSAEVIALPKDLLTLKKWYTDLILHIRMKLVPSSSLLENSANPIIYDCHVSGNEGVTISGIIETSHVVIHTWSMDGYDKIELDVYSCADFTPDEVFEHFAVFVPRSIHYKFIDRNAGLKEVEV